MKISKSYILSDSSVNCYGFRVLTSGYQMADFAVNPVGYYMHLRDNGVLLKWVDLHLKGDQIIGTPDINMSNARAQQTVDEVNNGFLNAASMGMFVALEWTESPEQMLPGQTGPTITKWYNRECSLVDVPGNYGALAIEDAKGNSVNLKDLMNHSKLDFSLHAYQNSELVALEKMSNHDLFMQGKFERLKALNYSSFKLRYREFFNQDYPELINSKRTDTVNLSALAECNNAELTALLQLSGDQLYMQGKFERLKELSEPHYTAKFNHWLKGYIN